MEFAARKSFVVILITLNLIHPKFYSQKKYTLEECMALAVKNNVTLQQALLNVENARLNFVQSQAAPLPNLNAGFNHTYNYGKSIDRFTNTFANSSVLSQNIFLGSSLTLWSGFMQWHGIKAQQYFLNSQKELAIQQERELKLAVVTSFLNLLLTMELESVSEQQALVSKEQYERNKQLAEWGQISKSVELEMRAQWANDKSVFISAQNNTKLAQLTLAQLVNEPNLFYIQIAAPETVNVPEAPNFKTKPQEAVLLQNGYKAMEWQVLGAEQNWQMNKGRQSPAITANFAMGSGTSGLYKKYENMVLTGEEPIGYLKNGDLVYAPTFSFQNQSVVPFKDQISDNLNRSVGISASWAVFNGLQTQTAIKQAKINLMQARLNLELKRQALIKEWVQAECNATGAFQKLMAAQEQEEASLEAFKLTEQKFAQGAAGVFEYNLQKTRYYIAKSSKLQARYEYAFRIKVLDFYNGAGF